MCMSYVYFDPKNLAKAKSGASWVLSTTMEVTDRNIYQKDTQ